MQSIIWWFTTMVIALSFVQVSQGCSCQMVHPQTAYCNSDFVILARVKRQTVLNDTIAYKVRIRKPYKMSEKAEVALKSGRLLSPSSDGLCKASLEIGKLYVISGRINSLKARIHMCNFMREWGKISKRQRKGFKRMYQQGCLCNIKHCPYRHCKKIKDSCNWHTLHYNDKYDCERMQGICLRSASNNCMWTRNKLQTACMRNLTTNHTPLTKKMRLTNSL